MNGDDVFEREQDQIEVDRLRRELVIMTERWARVCNIAADDAFRANRLDRELAELTEDVGKCHDAIGEDRASDTSELWKFFETHKQIIYRLREREDEIAAEMALADRLGKSLERHEKDSGWLSPAQRQALAAWKEARRGTR